LINGKKLVFVGPSGVGKTTLEKVYFEYMNPISLLKASLEPSRGVNSKIYTTTEIDLGVFDLAGQENEIWFSDQGKEVFSESNIIICVFDISNSLESIIKFIIDIYKLKKDLHLDSCNIIAFLHKIDLRSSSYVQRKLKIIQDFITIQHPQGKDFEIYQTSITKDNFYNTFCIISEILQLIIDREKNPIKGDEFQKLKNQLSILIKSDINVKHNMDDLARNFNINVKEAQLYIRELEKLGFAESFDNYKFFKLTNRAYYFKYGLEQHNIKKENSHFNKNFDFFHIFLCLKEKEE
jgi:GTPase SAR1 family protein